MTLEDLKINAPQGIQWHEFAAFGDHYYDNGLFI